MVGVTVIRATADLVEIDPRQARSKVTRTVLETALPATTDAERDKVAEVLTTLLQREIEVWTHEDDLPGDEETLEWSGPSPGDADQMTSRYGKRMRWERDGPDKWLVSTEDIITVKRGEPDYIVSLRVARR